MITTAEKVKNITTINRHIAKTRAPAKYLKTIIVDEQKDAYLSTIGHAFY